MHTTNSYCMISLGQTGITFSANGNVTVGSPSCGIADDSNRNPATNFKGGSGTVLGPFSVVGQVNVPGDNFTLPSPDSPNSTRAGRRSLLATGEKVWVMKGATQAPNCSGKSQAPNFSSGPS